VSLFSPDELDRLHGAALAILERVGVEMPHEETLSRLHDLGAAVEGQRVRFSPEMVQACLDRTPKSFTLFGRDESKRAPFGVGARNYNSIAGEALWVDEPGGPRRYCTLDDVRTAARLGEALPALNIVGAMADPQEIEPGRRCVAVCAELIRGTTKPFLFWFHDRASARYVGETLAAVRGGRQALIERPFTYPLLEPISPLRYPFHGVDLLYETCEWGMPVAVGPMAQMGVSAPCTVAGTIAQEHAEVLAGLCVVQAIRPGTPVCYGGICHALDMRTTQMIFSGPEQALFGVGMTELGKRLGLPVYINVGLTDAKRPDAQAGLEIGATLMLGAAAGADVFGHLGIAGVDQGASPDMLVFQHEVIRYVESVLRSVDVSDSTLALDLVEEVGPGGSFLDKVHTARSFRREMWFPDFLDRTFYDPWQEAGAWSMEQVCRDQREKLLKEHQVAPLDAGLDREMSRIVRAAGGASA
jgi:trimethylamine--corrinoid protein Co-methyltransferase